MRRSNGENDIGVYVVHRYAGFCVCVHTRHVHVNYIPKTPRTRRSPNVYDTLPLIEDTLFWAYVSMKRRGRRMAISEPRMRCPGNLSLV